MVRSGSAGESITAPLEVRRVAILDVLKLLGVRSTVLCRGDSEFISAPAPVLPGEVGAISFSNAEPDVLAGVVAASRSSLILVQSGVSFAEAPGGTWVVRVDHARTTYVEVLSAFFTQPRAVGVHPSAVLSADAKVGVDLYVGANASVGAAVIGDRCSIGAGAVILDCVAMGNDVIVGPNTTIGFTGFGYARADDGTPIPFPHFGGVRIGDRVEIGANTAVDRGTLSDTCIDDDAKIDNLVHVAHNCHIKRGAFVIAHTILCGGVVIGERAWVAPNSSILEHVKIGNDATVGLAATVIRDVPDGTLVVGSPARPITPRS